MTEDCRVSSVRGLKLSVKQGVKRFAPSQPVSIERVNGYFLEHFFDRVDMK